jgi:hypothetical protein
MVAAVGQEHRLGRWTRIKEAKNGVCVARLAADAGARLDEEEEEEE